MLKFLVGALGITGVVYLGLCGWLWAAQRRLMFLPSPVMESTPQRLGLTYENLRIPVADGAGHLHGWWLPTDRPGNLTILYLHGNAGNISSNLGKAALLRSLGAAVLTVDYRGYGLSSGPFPREQQLYEDAWAAWQFLHHEKGVAPQHLVVYGHSLGGAIGIDLARRVPQLAGLMVEGTFTSMGDMAARSEYNGWFPVRRLLTQRFDSLDKARQLTVPTLYLHGTADASVPATMSEALYHATPAPKDLWLVPGADHNDLTDWAGQDFTLRLQEFLQNYALAHR
jgi:pimeloyl-ACP methyl ester carboxylesterase